MNPEDLNKMEDLMKRQEKIGNDVEALIKNYKKMALDRRTLKFYGKRLDVLQQYRQQFQNNDESLDALENIPKTHDYYVKNYYETISALIDDHAKICRQEIERMAPPLNDVYQEQITLARNIAKIASDGENLPAPQRTKSYYEKAIRDLQLMWADFDAGHNIIKVLAGMNSDHEYFKQQLYDTTLMKTRKAINSLEELKKSSKKEDIPKKPASTNEASNELTNLIWRQKAMIASLQRLIQANLPEDASAPTLKAKEKLWEQIQELHFAIWASCGDPIEKGYDMDAYITIEEDVMTSFAAAAAATQNKNQQPSTSSHTTITPNAILPKINIPKFDGNYGAWATFSDLFSKIVHNQQIAAVQKFWYLKSLLTGEAERLIRHLALTETNYDTAWSTLQARYDNKRVVTASLIQPLLNHPNISGDAKSVKELHDLIKENLAALENLNIDTSSWDPILMQIFVKKLDRHNHSLYEASLSNPKDLQKVTKFLGFLEQRFQALESMGPKDKSKKDTKENMHTSKAATTAATPSTCKVCNSQGHPIFYCKKFLDMKPKERSVWVRNNKLCINCFKSDHRALDCNSQSCKKCPKKHNSLLHFDTKPKSKEQANSADQRPTTTQTTSTTKESSTTALSAFNSVPEEGPLIVAATNNRESNSYVLLATAKVNIIANNGQTHEFRAILDAGSQVNIVTQRLINKLSLSTSKTQLSIEGVGQRTQNSRARVNVALESCIGSYATRFEAYVMPQIISSQPSRSLDVSNWNIPQDLELADPLFNKSERIDLLIGAEYYHHLLKPEQISLGDELPLLQNTVLGWIVIGKTQLHESDNTVTCAVFPEEEERVSEIIERFWKIDELNEDTEAMTNPEKICEDHFAKTVTRNQDDRFVVRLPFSNDPSALGNSQVQAERRFESIEKRLKSDATLYAEYKKFMEEYESLGHMEKIERHNIPSSHYFIPHHCVLKPDSSTTKLRVVFDASAKTSTGCSLNDILFKGPTVQSQLFSILLRFRVHRFVFTADIEKMYRQVLVHQDDTQYQLIVWRSSDDSEFQYFRLKTVTYGTTAAPYLATKCLQYLANQNMTTNPIGARVVRNDFYVDDCLSGANDIFTAQEMQKQTTKLLQSAGFKLRKWCANHQQLLSGIPQEEQEINLDLDEHSNQTIKTLGLIWLPKSDELCGRAQLPALTVITKRTVSSDLARIFDPLGLFGPITVTAKIFMQQLWDLKIQWDEQLPIQLQQQWTRFRNEMSIVNQLKTDRHIFNKHIPTQVQIHTFADASEKAYGAAVYLRATNKDKTITTRLLCAKSRVAPLKRLTIPRLELCAALLGAELTNRVRADLNFTDTPTFLWSDSEIVLSWIQSQSSTLHAFVANRISKIQQLTNPNQWRHVSSQENPADLLSRGTTPEKFKSCTTWFYGPLFLYGSKQWWLQPNPKILEISNDIERKTKRVVAVTHQCSETEYLLQKIDHKNSFSFLQNCVGYLRRPFIRPKPQNLALSPAELRQALLFIVKGLQSSEFQQEIRDLRKHKTVASSSPLSPLSPFIDDHGILRVGGRLEFSNMPIDSKHPMLLPYNAPIVKLLFQQKHNENKHCGPQALLAIIRQTFWPIKGKIIARNVVHSCIRCSRAKPKLMHQIMGNLPADRVIQARPFLTTGIDYCGPFWIHYKIRGKKPTKAYLAVFCCFATKAIHLELVTDLTTKGFLGALMRFTARRGRCKTIYCDNATNFVGAKNYLEELNDSIFSKKAKEQIIRENGMQGIDFKFIPPRAPHFGGLWEAAVKSAKYLLTRSVTTASLTYEELETVIVGVEAILNSRPITPMSSNPNDLCALTPGHFLIGEPLTTIPSATSRHESMNLATRWDLVSRLQHNFWTRWSGEYLNELQYRHKWKQESHNLKTGDMVIIKDDNLPIMKWPLGRVQRVYQGEDGVVRVADIKTATGISKRGIQYLAPLPIDNTQLPQIPEAERKSNQISPDQPTQTSLMVSIPLERIRKGTIQESETTPRKISRIQPNLLFAIITLLLLPLTLCSPIKQHQFPNTPGIYFEGIGSVNQIVGDWKIITYFDLAPIQAEMTTYKNGIIILENLCPLLQQKTMCFELVNHFKNVSISLEAEQTLMSKHRFRRGAINIVGNIANKLFGVLDNEYAEDISKQINQLNSNEKRMFSMIQNQTSVIDATVNIVGKESKAINLQITALANNISKDMAEFKKHINLLEVYTSTTTQLSLMAENLQQIEAAIFNVLTDTKHGRISPLLISPQQLQHEILKIKSHLPNGLRLPFSQDDAIHLYSLITSQSGISSQHVLFIIKLPLTNNEVFDLFHLVPIPAIINGTLMKIHPETSLLAVSPHRDQYFALTDKELQSCLTIIPRQLLCTDKNSKYHQDADEYSCEFNLLRNKTDDTCVLSVIRSETIWNPLQQTNQWIFGSRRVTQVTTVCNGITNILELQGSSLLTLQDDCTIKHHTATIQSHRTFSDEIHESHVAFGNLTILTDSTKQKVYNASVDLHREVDQLRQLHEQIKTNGLMELPDQVFTKTIHHHITGYATLSLVLAIIIYLTWKVREQNHVKITPPSARPRFTVDPQLTV